MKYVFDTNIITAILNGDQQLAQKIKNSILDGETFFINVITYYEIKRGLLAVNATKKLRIFENLCQKFKVLLLDALPMFDIASQIYSDLKTKGSLINDADILIASMVIFHNCILISDDSDFERIDNLQLENWLRH